jgi:hypothetical protein
VVLWHRLSPRAADLQLAASGQATVVVVVPIWPSRSLSCAIHLSDDDGDHLCHASGCLLPPPTGPAGETTDDDGRGRSPPPAGGPTHALRPRPSINNCAAVGGYAAPANTSDELKPPLHCMHHRSLASGDVCRIANERRRIMRRACWCCDGAPS